MSDTQPSALYRGQKASLQFVQDQLQSGQDTLEGNGSPSMIVAFTGDGQDPVNGSLIEQIVQDAQTEFNIPVDRQLLLPVRLGQTQELSLAVYGLGE